MNTISVSRSAWMFGQHEFLYRMALPHLGRDAALEVWSGRGGTRWFWPGQSEHGFVADDGEAVQFVTVPGDAVTGALSFRLEYFEPALEHEVWDAVCAAREVECGMPRPSRSCVGELEIARAAIGILASDAWRSVFASAARKFEAGEDPDEREVRLVGHAVELRQSLTAVVARFPELAESLILLDASYNPLRTAPLFLDEQFYENLEVNPASAAGWWLFPLELERQCPAYLVEEALLSLSP